MEFESLVKSENIDNIVRLLELEDGSSELEALYSCANSIKKECRGSKVYFRGLIEISNICIKNCFYCGIRKSNNNVYRYELSSEKVLEEAQYALDSGYGSVVIQGGERNDAKFISKITHLVSQIKRLRRSDGAFPNLSLGITLSLGEQTKDVYREWFNAGAHRYLLRIESSNREHYNIIHPINSLHSYDTRVQAIKDLMEVGFKTGTGVMIGTPGQTLKNLAEDLLFFKRIGVGMVGMGPYIPHRETPLGECVERNPGFNAIDSEKLSLSLKMIAILRILMPHINIAATTALQVLDKDARERALLCGANVIMPNVTDLEVKGEYNLYDGKPGVKDSVEETKQHLLANLREIGVEVGWNELGD